MLSAPANIPATTVRAFATTFATGRLEQSSISSDRPARSASCSTGTRPACDTRFRSSNTGSRPCDDCTYEMPFRTARTLT